MINHETLSSNSRRRDIAAILFIAALVLLFFWRIITPKLQDRAVFRPGDFTDQFWAFRMEEARAFSEGRLPLWSGYYNSGHPFLADVQSAVFYPPSLLWTLGIVALRGALGGFSLLDLEIEAIFHFILAGAFMFLWARELVQSRAAALVAALTFTFGGYLTSYPPQQLAILETAAWLPLGLLFIHRALYRGGKYYFAAGAVLGIAALAGHPQTLLFVIYASAIYFFWECRHHSHTLPHYVVRFAIVLFIAAGISAAQWIPALEYQSVSTRASISWADAARGFATLDPIQMILPGFINAFQSPLYVGVLPLWLAVFALWQNRSRDKNYWGLVALGSLLVSFGFYAFAYALFYLLVPGFAIFRGQERLALVISFSLAMLAGYGMRDLLSTQFDAGRARRVWALLPVGIVISGMFMLTLYVSGTVRQSGRVAFLGDRAGLMVILFLLASVLIAWRLRMIDRSGVPAFIALLIALIGFDLFSINTAPYNAEPTPRYPDSPLIQTIQNDKDIFRVVDEGKMPGHFGIAYRLEEIGGISPLRIAQYDFLKDNLPEEKLWQLLNVKYVITGRPGFADADVIANDGDTRLLRLNNSLPRAWFVYSAQDKVDNPTALAAISTPTFEPHEVAYVADALPFPPIANAQMLVSVEKQEPVHLVLSITTPTDQLLVLSGNYYYPGWVARVDGAPAQIVRADIALSAVPVRAGARRVELVFDPWSMKIGLAISLVTLVGLTAILAIPSKRN